MRAMRIFVCSVWLAGCATHFSSRSTPNEIYCTTGPSVTPCPPEEAQRGIPYFMPMAVVLVRSPVLVSREESLYAMLNVDGFYSVAVKVSDSDDISKALEVIVALREKLSRIPVQEKEKPDEVVASRILEYDKDTGKLLKKTETMREREDDRTATAEDGGGVGGVDIGKAIEVIMVPDTRRKYYLLVDPSMFASHDFGITLKDGWRFDGLTSNTGENAATTAMKDLVSELIKQESTRGTDRLTFKRSQLDHIAKLIETKLQESTESTEQKKNLDGIYQKPIKDAKPIVIRFVGFAKKVTVKSLVPGVYPFEQLITTNTKEPKGSLPAETTTQWYPYSP